MGEPKGGRVMKRIEGIAVLIIVLFLTSCRGEGGDTGDSRDMEGSLAPASLPAPALIKQQTVDACNDISICCSSYTGAMVVTEVNADCSFSIALPLNSFCFCGAFSGDDSDGEGCPDNYLASLGCSENGFSGAIPIYADADDTTDAISLGESDFQGTSLVPTTDPCSQVDQDDDGVTDADDADDDGDAVNDTEDSLTSSGCDNADEVDSDDNGIPDIYEPELWAEFDDSDGDGIPAFCDDDETSCEASTDDSDGNCIPDIYEYCDDDSDGDGVGYCYDCNDTDSSSTTECYSDYYCSIDADEDGFDLCTDCDDTDANTGSECFSYDDYCALYDEDGDGFNICYDCDDTDASSGAECYSHDYCSDYDTDGDGYNICFDCDDNNSTSTIECYDDDYCSTYDTDGDGFNICQDCDDTNPASTYECYYHN